MVEGKAQEELETQGAAYEQYTQATATERKNRRGRRKVDYEMSKLVPF